MTKKEFLSGTPFRYDIGNDVFMYDGMSIKIQKEPYFDYYCNVDEITSKFFVITPVVFGMPYNLVILFSRCIVVDL